MDSQGNELRWLEARNKDIIDLRGVFPRDSKSRNHLRNNDWRVDCKVVFAVDQNGRAYEGTASGCPESFQKAALKALSNVGWEPPMWQGEPTRAISKMNIGFTVRPSIP